MEKLDKNIKALNLENSNIYYVSEQGVKLCMQALNQLRILVVNSTFNSNKDEIEFYKTIKLRVLSKLIYFVENFNVNENLD